MLNLTHLLYHASILHLTTRPLCPWIISYFDALSDVPWISTMDLSDAASDDAPALSMDPSDALSDRQASDKCPSQVDFNRPALSDQGIYQCHSF